MKLTLLGTGGATPYKNKSACSYLIETDNQDIIIDAGFGVSTQYRKKVTDINRLNHVLLTHMHMDHTCELPMLMFWAFLMGKNSGFHLYGPQKNVERFVTGLFDHAYYFINDMLQEARQRDFTYTVAPIDPTPENPIVPALTVDGLQIDAVEVKHFSNFPCLAYKLTSQTKKIVISGDTTICDGIIELCKDADELILDVNMHESFGHNVFHLIPSEVNTILETSRAKKVYITHQGPNLIGKEQECIDIIKSAHPHVEVI